MPTESALMKRIVVAMTGASGAIYAIRLLEILLTKDVHIHLVISPAAAMVLQEELQISIDLKTFNKQELPKWFAAKERFYHNAVSSEFPAEKLTYHHYQDFFAGIASGSFQTDGMVICPCSSGTLASLATGQSTNLIHRVADVHLKEHRKLIIVSRETPISSIQIENMHRLANAGAVMLPASPGFYHGPTTIGDLIDFVVGRICDQLNVPVEVITRWGATER